MKKKFEMGANFSDDWSADNQNKKNPKTITTEIKLPEKHQLYCTKEKRRGKTVTIVQPFCLEKPTLQNLLKTLKKKLGTGGTIKTNRLEFQGDISKNVRENLEGLSYRFK